MANNLPEPDLYIDYRAFLSNNFDPKEYANSTINATSDGNEDITISLAKLSFSIDNLNKQLYDQVTTHFEDLISQAAGIRDLEVVLNTVKDGIQSLNKSLDSLKTKIYAPYSQIKNYTIQLERLQSASELLRNVERFFYLSRCLESQLSEIYNEKEKGNEYIKAASNLGELEVLLQDVNFDGIELIQAQVPVILQARNNITGEAQQLLNEGINKQNRTDISLGLQIFHNLHEMGERVSKFVEDISGKLLNQMRDAVDVTSLQREVKDSGTIPIKGIRRLGSEPTTGTTALWATALWKRMEVLMDEISESCSKIYTLERVLAGEKDTITHNTYLDEVSKILDGGLIQHFWKILSLNFEKELKEATKGSTFLQQTFIGGYPKLLRLFHDFFAKLEKRGDLKLDGDFQSQETLVMLHSISSFEAGYLARSVTRMFDSINMAFPTGLSRAPPTKSDVTNIIRAISSELEVAKLDSNLLRSVAKNVVKALNLYCVKSESMATIDPTTYQISGPGPATASQIINLEIITTLYQLHQSVWKILEEYPDAITEIMFDAVEHTRKVMLNIVDPMMQHIKKELENTLIKIHREDFSRQISKSFIHGQQSEGQYSTYMIELSNRIKHIQNQYLSRISCGLESKEWIKELGKRILSFWLLHASLVRSLSEAGKLKLISDMSQLEYSLNQLLIDNGLTLADLDNEYKALKSFRQLLFLDNSQLTAAHHTASLPLLILIHHIIVRSSSNNNSSTLQLPHKIYGWSELEYSKWLDEHNEDEAIELIKGCLRTSAEIEISKEGELTEEKMIRNLLKERAGIEV
ncbi:Golgi transport complex subunit 5-domain-containing protein [Glomus cerebriforme]|uniref:Conserved oligomeric Golgi complex subunit 5 n=1 Tax=Glomus cerebriforme TaxID=658196 RepID=A0A397T6U9_9GLOM|nr:Golgi transport complex subunit 5-domain-containing protein [Glomus cerebriforme]